MKKLALKVLLGFFAVILATDVIAQQRSVADVLSIVEQSLISRGQSVVKSKSFAEKAAMLIPSSDVYERIGIDEAELADKVAESFYVYAPGGGQGFIIVSADKRMSSVLAYADSGDFDFTSLPDNAKAWIRNYVAEAQVLSQTIGLTRPVGEQVGAGASVGPLLTTQWSQNYPYNALCPIYSGTKQSVTGCVATAMAQVMYYYKKPTRGVGQHSYITTTHGLSMSKDFSATTFNWSLMKNTYSAIGNTNDEVQAIGDLMLSCGVAVDMDYSSSSGSNQNSQMKALATYFGYDADMHIVTKDYMELEDWHSSIIAELDASRPVLISGQTPRGYGHAFVIDGYQGDEGDYPFYHINWGWGGVSNGYFKMTAMTDSDSPDDPYSERLAVILGTKPDDGVAENRNYLQIEAIDVEAESVDVSQGEDLVLSIDRCINGGIQAFTGSITIYLVSNSQERTAVYSFNLSDLKIGYYASQSNLLCAIPGNLPSGEYTIEAFARNNGSGTPWEITIGSRPEKISIINDPNVYYPSVMATNISVNKGSGRNFSLSATGICNFKETVFTGTLQMVVTDYYKKYITSFGTTRSISGLGKLSFYSDTFNFNGALPSSVGNGAYRLALGANQSGYASWGLVQKYSLQNGYIVQQGLDATTKFWVVNGNVTLTAPFKLGDVNSDDNVNVADLSGLIRLVLDNHDSQDVTFWAADVNEDGRLNVGDYSVLVDQIISGAPSTSFAGSTAFNNTIGNEGLVDAYIYVDEDMKHATLAIKLNANKELYNSMQFDLLLPSFMRQAENAVNLSARTRGFKSVARKGRVLLYNFDDADIPKGTEEVMFLNFDIVGSVPQNAEIVVKNIVLSKSQNCEAVGANNVVVSAGLSDLTGVASVDLADNLTINTTKGAIQIMADATTAVKVVAIDGKEIGRFIVEAGSQRTVRVPAGVYLINNYKVSVK